MEERRKEVEMGMDDGISQQKIVGGNHGYKPSLGLFEKYESHDEK